MAVRPTKNPRIAFVPSDEVHELVRQLSKASGKSRASIVSGFMDEIQPVVMAQLDALNKIASRPEQVRQQVQDFANRSIMLIAQTSLDLDKPKQPRKRRAVKNEAP